MRLSFERCVKAFCSEWDWNKIADTMDASGKIYETYYIISSPDRRPERGECLAIAEYLGWTYKNGYFYRRIR